MKPPHSNGLCSKHRRWVDKGNMTDDLVVLKPVAQKNIYKHAKCKIDGCERRPRRNWMCEKHSSLYREGYITKTGDRIIKKRAVKKYPKDFGCVVCGKKGKISKGFCNYHYEHYRKGVIGFDGVKIGELKRVHKYSIDSMCKAEGCNRKPRCKGWCERCRIWLVRGYYSNNGKLLKSLPISRNKGRKCSIPSCEKPAHCKTLCRLHYVRKQTGYIGPSGRKNKGQKCSEKNCQRPAACRTMCSLHYYRFKVQNKEQFFKKANLPEQQST